MAIYLDFDGIKGNVTAEGYVDMIQLDHFAFGIHRGITMDAGNMTNREATRPALSEVTVSKAMDCSCTNLFKAGVAGVEGKTATIRVVRTGAAGNDEFLSYELENCMVSSYSISGDAENEPQEQISLSYTKIIAQYKDSDATHGKQKQTVAGFDLVKCASV